MKKILTIMLLSTALMAAHAQAPATGTFSLIPKVGMALSKWSDYNIYETIDVFGTRVEQAQFGPGFAVGIEGEYMVHPNIGVSLGLMYAHEGTDHELKEAEAGLDYLNVPLMANFYVTPQLAFCVGGQLGFMLDHDTEMGLNLNTVDFSIPVGVRFEYRDFMLGLRYNWGLTKVFKNELFKSKNQVIQIDLGYRIAL